MNDSKPLRLWPGVALVALQWFGWLVLPLFVPEALPYGVMGGLLCGLLVIVWWAFFSRAPKRERWIGVLLMIVALAATPLLLHESIATGMMGMMFFVYALPLVSLVFVLWAVVSRRLAPGPRIALMVAVVLIACGVWTLVRTAGMTGSAGSDFAWRWSETHEDQLLAQTQRMESIVEPAPVEPTTPPAAPVADEVSEPEDTTDEEAISEPSTEIANRSMPAPEIPEPEWPGFRGPDRDSVVRGLRIDTDWSASPPVELWRRPVGPGWSSFAVQDDRIYTQEQRGDEEWVTCYDAATGEPTWIHRDDTRFWESNAGAGPRATPTLADGRVYTLGATGIVNVLDAETGALVWSRDVGIDAEVETPGWGFSGSPWVVDDLVVVAASGRLVAYDRTTGTPRWMGPNGGHGYSSPHRVKIDGVEQIVFMSASGAVGVSPGDGTVLWEHEWSPNARIVQPALTADGEVLISAGNGQGMRRLAVSQGTEGWTAEERWTSIGLKPYFNDFVVHEGHAYGFDGSILSSIDLETGERAWKGGRYGHGQLVLLADQDVLLVLSEKGELALVEATPEGFSELARVPAIEGKTWNHPVLVDDLLLTRNGQEMAAFRLTRAGG